MIDHLKMNKKRVIDVGTAVHQGDVVNKEMLDNFGTVSELEILPRMTSPIDPSPFSVISQYNISNAYKACSTRENKWTTDVDSRQTLTVNFGAVKVVNCVKMVIGGASDSLAIHSQGLEVYKTLDEVGGDVVFQFPTQTVEELVFTFTPVDIESFSVSFLRVTLLKVNFDKQVNVYTSGDDAAEAVSLNFLTFQLAPLKSLVTVGYINPPMTSNNNPTGYAATCQPTALTNHEPYLAFNFDSNNNWVVPLQPQETTAYLEIQIPLPLSAVAFEIAAREDTYSAGASSFELTGSNDGISYDSLLLVPTAVPQTKVVIQLPSQSAPYSRFRLVLTKLGNNTEIGLNCLNIQTNVLAVSNRRITNVGNGIDDGDCATMQQISNFVTKNNPVMIASLDMSNNRVRNCNTAQRDTDVATNSDLAQGIRHRVNSATLAANTISFLVSHGSVFLSPTSPPTKPTLSAVNTNNVPNPTVSNTFQITGGNVQFVQPGVYNVTVAGELTNISSGSITFTFELRSTPGNIVLETFPSRTITAGFESESYQETVRLSIPNSGDIIAFYVTSSFAIAAGQGLWRNARLLITTTPSAVAAIIQSPRRVIFLTSAAYTTNDQNGVQFTPRSDIPSQFVDSTITTSGPSISLNTTEDSLFAITLDGLVTFVNPTNTTTLTLTVVSNLGTTVFTSTGVVVTKSSFNNTQKFTINQYFVVYSGINSIKLVISSQTALGISSIECSLRRISL
ncbi:MAG: hypothetical protein ACRCXX_10205 [Cetobacterium sp.]|uniref:hypothetical protein n=1 Tax=Cetobacterium sp. TaxID=2071632 RepID=UPI003F3F73CC